MKSKMLIEFMEKSVKFYGFFIFSSRALLSSLVLFYPRSRILSIYSSVNVPFYAFSVILAPYCNIYLIYSLERDLFFWEDAFAC